ncbi:MAG: HAMP domain-containing protein [Candidatus Limnocylindrales bacterium]
MVDTKVATHTVGRFRRLGLQRRIMLYVTLGLTTIFAVLALVGLDAIDQATQLVFRERLSTASVTAGIIARDLSSVGDDARQSSRSLALSGAPSTPSDVAREVLEAFSQRTNPSVFFRVSGVWLLDRGGLILAAAGQPTAVLGVLAPLDLRGLAGDGEGYAVVPAAGLAAGDHPFAAVIVSVPASDPGDFQFLVMHTVSINSTADFVPGAFGAPEAVPTATAAPSASEGGYHLEVIDPAGRVVLGIGADEHPGLTSRHFHAVQSLMAVHGSAALVHEPAPGEADDVHVMAVVPLEASPFYVVLEQPVDIALALPMQLRQRLILSIGLGSVVTLAVAWVTTRHVVKPTEQLTAAAQRIAGGDLASPIDVMAMDEVGELAESLDEMRQRLRTAYDAAERTNRELETRVAERTARLGQVLRNTISAQEEERRRLARELHDETAQRLAALSIALDRARDGLDASNPALPRILEAKTNVSGLLADTRRLILGLRPTVLDDLGLIPAIRWYCETNLAERGIEVDIKADKAPPRLPSHTEVALFRIVQEAANNVARHSRARHARIEVRFDGAMVTVVVSDDGIGFEVGPVLDPSSAVSDSVGLQGMQERVNLLGGRLDITSTPGVGTSITVEAPVSDGSA